MCSKKTTPEKIPSPTLIAEFTKIVGEKHAITDNRDQAPHLREWRDRYFGQTPAVLVPGSTREVSEILQLAHQTATHVVPQGGNTGLVGGQIPHEHGHEIVLSTRRLTKTRARDADGQTLIVEAGQTLTSVQKQAEEMNCVFPLSLASEGSCQIGGNLATNAGGVNVLNYGTARNLVLGLEVVLADGQIWDGLKTLKKDNTGYDLRDLFIGSEGTLGIITAAALKLFPKPAERATTLVAVKDLQAAGKLFTSITSQSPDAVTAFEFFPDIAMDFVTRHISSARRPFKMAYPWYVLVETSRKRADNLAKPNLETTLEHALEKHIASDAVFAHSQTQTENLWKLRESISEAQKPEGGSIKHDVSVPIATIPDFIHQANQTVSRLCPGARPVPFGHYGDGNVHYNISQPTDMNRDDFLALWDVISTHVHDLVRKFGGSISAEHGIGQLKRDELVRTKDKAEIEMMRAIKQALDPKGILNPGKVL